MRLIVLMALAALVCSTVWAARASSAGPSAGQVYAFGNNNESELGKTSPMADPTPGLVPIPASAGVVTRVSVGDSQTLAVGSDGKLYSFGDNSLGQLGRPTATLNDPNPLPVSFPGATGPVIDASGGAEFSLALTATGQVYNFGDNTYGENGNGTSGAGPTNATTAPVQAMFPSGAGKVIQVSAGQDQVLALTNTDQLFAWGSDMYGESGPTLSYGTATPVTTPTNVTPTHTGTLIGVAAGDLFSLALTSSGEVLSFGANSNGELGRAITGATDANPQAVSFPGLSGSIVQICAGAFHGLALSSSGQLYAWGNNAQGQLGNTGPNSQTPELVAMPAGSGSIVQISAGGRHSLVLTSTGRLYAFGDNNYGQLGSGTNNGTDNPNPTPTAVPIPGGVNLDAVALGSEANHTAVISAALSVSGAALPAGVTGTTYSARATASGGTPPYHWAASGLPPQLAIDGATGQITGTPVTAGGYSPTLSVTDARGITASAQPALTISSPGSGSSKTPTTQKGPQHSSLVVDRIAAAGARATLVVRCTGATGQRCLGAISGTTTEHFVAAKLVAVTSAATPAKPKKPKAKTKTKKLKVVSRRYTIKAGKSARIAIALDKAGRKLLNHFYSVPVKLSITNSGQRTTQKTTFRYGLIRAPIDYFWNYRAGYSFIGNLAASNLQRSWQVTLTCHGGGCPLKRKALKIHAGKASATAALKGAHLHPGATVQLTISARNAVAEVLRFTIVPNALPNTTSLCQTPDQHAPGACSR